MDAAPGSPGAFRIGSVPYLNAVPLTYGLEAETQFLPPSTLARELHAGRLDAALLSVTEALFHPDYAVLDGWGITSDGPVASVFLAHRRPLEDLGTVHLDPASCTSVNLLRVLLAEQGGSADFAPLEGYADAARKDNVLLIGNPAIEFRRAPHEHALWDLGEAWRDRTGLPFVYAVWVLRRQPGREALATRLRAAAEAGQAALEHLIAERTDYDLAFRRAYLGGHIRYPLGVREKAGLNRFAELLGRSGDRTVYPVHYV